MFQEKFPKILFCLIVFFISSQVGLHFWPSFSYVNGIRIDYISPTLYFLDVLIIIWIALGIRDLETVRVKSPATKILLALFVLGLIINFFLSKSPGAHIFGLLKLGEFGLFGWLVVKSFTKDYIRPFVLSLAASSIISSILAIWQFVIQSSVGGFWYYFGERTFNISAIGISTVNLGQLILRPYAAFPHPNVLAFFLLAAIIFAFMRIPYENKLIKTFLIISVLISSLALILTFSRTAILISVCFFFYAIYTKAKRKSWVLGLLGLLGLSGILIFSGTITSELLLRGIDFRTELFLQSILIFFNNPYFGIGLNNFFVHQVDLIKDISPILFQPPHNIFVIALLSLGILGWWVFPAIFLFAIRSLLKESRIMNHESRDFSKSVLFVLISVIAVGMFDHFFLTLEQGQIILALILGFSFIKLHPDSFKVGENKGRK